MEPLRVLSQTQMEMIDEAAQKILERTGIQVHSAEARQRMGKFGCVVDEATSIVRFPRSLTRDVVARMRKGYAAPGRPDRMPVRYSHVRFRKYPHQVHADFTVSAGGFVPFIYDFEGVRRNATRKDVLCAINMINHLDQINMTGLPVSDQDIPADKRPLAMAATLAKYTHKIGGIETFAVGDVKYMIEMAQVVAGSAEEFKRNPRLVGYAEVRSPLCFDENMADIFMAYIKAGVPQTVDSMPCGGTTAPMTGAGILALGAAESIAPMALAFAIDENAVVGIDITPTYADMSSGLYRYAGSERANLLMARVQLLSEYYGCPCGVHGGKTDSCFLNEQAGAEKMASMLLPVLAGAVAIGTVGHIENAVTFSPVQLMIDAEMARFVRRAVVQPFRVDEETLALDLVHEIGPGGNFLNEMHTAEHFREELLLSPLFAAKAWDVARGSPESFESVAKATAMAREFWKEPEGPVLTDDQVKAIDGIVKRATGL